MRTFDEVFDKAANQYVTMKSEGKQPTILHIGVRKRIKLIRGMTTDQMMIHWERKWTPDDVERFMGLEAIVDNKDIDRIEVE